MLETFEFLSVSIRDLYFPFFFVDDSNCRTKKLEIQSFTKFNLLRTITYNCYSGIDCNLRESYGEAALSDVLHLLTCPDWILYL